MTLPLGLFRGRAPLGAPLVPCGACVKDVGAGPLTREFYLAERQDAIEEIRLLDLEVEALITAARQRRRVLLRRARRFERMVGAAGGVNRPVDDTLPWWARGD